MKVLLINGSPHEKGCTYTALSLIAGELNAAGIDTEILNVGTKPVDGGKGICDDAGCGKGGTLYPDFIRKNGYLRHDRRSDGGCGTDESADSEG